MLPALLGCPIILGTCPATRCGGKPKPEMVSKSTQTEAMATAVLMPVPAPRPGERSAAEECACIAPRDGEKFHSLSACRGLSCAYSANMLERCKLRG